MVEQIGVVKLEYTRTVNGGSHNDRIVARGGSQNERRGIQDHFKTPPDHKNSQKPYEKGMVDGHLVTLVKQYGDGRVTFTVRSHQFEEQVSVYLELDHRQGSGAAIESICGVRVRPYERAIRELSDDLVGQFCDSSCRQFSLRCIYAELLDNWLQFDSISVLG